MNPAHTPDLARLVEKHALENGLIQDGDRLLAAVSGGPDSVALARVLDELARRRRLSFEWSILHVNHHLRGEEADRDERFCRGLAESLGVAFAVEHVDVPAIREALGGSVEEVARRERLRIFEDAATRLGAGRVALGHHADDNLETVLHRILRGTGLRGLAGIPERRALSPEGGLELVRPLLPFTREEILAFLREVGQEFIEDSSNRSELHTRNWIRLSLLPELEEKLGPSVRRNVQRLAKHMSQANAFIDEHVREAAGQLLRQETDGTVWLEAAGLAELAPAVRAGVVSEAALCAGGPPQGILTVHHDAISSILSAGAGETSLPGGLLVRIESGRLIFASERQDEKPLQQLDLSIPGRVELPDGRTLSCAEVPPPAPSLEEVRRLSETTAYVDLDAVSPPLGVRGPRPGDRFRALGLSGQQKVQDLLINSKVPRSARKSFPLVVDQAQILWVVGLRLADRVRITPGTQRVLRISVE